MKTMNEYRELSLEALQEALLTLEKERFELKMKNAVRQLENTSQIRFVAHRIAQVQTAIRELERRSQSA
jgi:ribosomal protein L29